MIDYIQKGGLLMWPILVCSIISIAVFAEQARERHGRAVRMVGPSERPIVVGFSYGGPVALAYVEEFPQDVRALAWRIHVEEAELGRVLGDAYRAYQTRTARLIPGRW